MKPPKVNFGDPAAPLLGPELELGVVERHVDPSALALLDRDGDGQRHRLHHEWVGRTRERGLDAAVRRLDVDLAPPVVSGSISSVV